MKIFYEPAENRYLYECEAEDKNKNSLILVTDQPLSRNAIAVIGLDAGGLIAVLAMLEEEKTTLENVVEEFENDATFICNVWMRGCESLKDMFEGLREHSMYIRTEDELNEFIQSFADDWEEPPEKVRQELFSSKTGDTFIAPCSFGGYGCFISF